MSHLLSDKALYALWRVRHSFVGIRQLSRLRAYVGDHHAEQAESIEIEIATRICRTVEDAESLLSLHQDLPADLKSDARAIAVRADARALLHGSPPRVLQ